MLPSKADALRNAEQLAGQGNINAAIAIYRGLIEADPLDFNSIQALGDLYVCAGRIQEALHDLARLADRCAALGPAINAAPLLKKMLDLDPSNTPVRMKLATVYARSGKLEQAHQVFIEAGAAFARKGNPMAAMEAIRKALAIHPDSPQALAALEALERQTAPQATERLHAERPATAPAAPLVRDTTELAELGQRLSAASADFSEADVTDEFIVRQLFAAELLVGCGDINKALTVLKRIIHFRPDAIDVRTKLKDIYLRSGMMREASQEFLEIARIYESQGDAARAKDFNVRAQRLTQQLNNPPISDPPIIDPPIIANARPAPARMADKPQNANRDQIIMGSDTAQIPVAPPSPPPVVQTTQPSRVMTEPTIAATRREPAAPVAASASLSMSETIVADVSRRPSKTTLGLLAPAPEAVAKPRSRAGRVVFYAIAATITIALLSGWVVARRWYAAQIDRAYEALAKASTLPMQPPVVSAEPFALPRSEERMDVRAESPSPADTAAAVPSAQPPAAGRDAEAPRDASHKEPALAPITNPHTATANSNAASVPSKSAAPPPVVPAAPDVAANTERTPQSGPISLPPNGGSAEPPPPAAPRKAAVIVKGESLHRVQPDYPERARAARQTGSVIVEVSINERGDVVAAQALSGPTLLREPAVAAARRWKFKPATRDGKPTASVSTLTFNFKM